MSICPTWALRGHMPSVGRDASPPHQPMSTRTGSSIPKLGLNTLLAVAVAAVLRILTRTTLSAMAAVAPAQGLLTLIRMIQSVTGGAVALPTLIRMILSAMAVARQAASLIPIHRIRSVMAEADAKTGTLHV